jgi:IclR family transcriptional regulator, acetate operon repressor
VRSAERTLAALDFLVDAAPRAVRVTDVAQHLELSLATASRLLAALVERGYASRTSERRFTVGPRSLLLAKEWVATLRTAAAAPMARVVAATGESVMLAQQLGEVLVPIAWQPPRQRAAEMVDKLSGIGPVFPLWATATGRAMLGKLPPSHRARLLPEEYPRLTGRTVASSADLRQAIRDGERGGLHIENGELDPDMWCCAVALERGPMGEVLALAVISFGEPGAVQRPRVLKALRRESRDVGYQLSTL